MNNDTLTKIKSGLKDYLSNYQTSLSFYEDISRFTNPRNMKLIEIPLYTIQALYILSLCINQESAYFLARSSVFLYKNNNKFYALIYKEKKVFLSYEKHDNKFREERSNLIRIYQKMQAIQQQEIMNQFKNGQASIFNHLERDIKDLKWHEEMLDKILANNAKHPETEAYRDLFLPRKAFKWTFEIKSYILSVFSIIEYTINCLLPFWEQENGDDWSNFLTKCKIKNPNIETWTDLYDKEKINYKTRTVNYKDIVTPAYIDVVNIGIEVLDERNPQKRILDKYTRLKRTYRNILTHGELGSNFTYGLTLSMPSVEDFGIESIPLFDDIINLNFAAYNNVAEFFDDFIDFCAHEYPGYWAYIMSAHDIPIRPVEYFKYTNGELEKTNDYTRYLTLIHTFILFSYIEGITPNINNKTSENILIELLRGCYPDSNIEEDELYDTFINELVDLQQKLSIPDVLHITTCDEEDLGSTENAEIAHGIINLFKKMAPDTFGKLSTEEIEHLSPEQAVELLEQTNLDYSNLDENDAIFFDKFEEDSEEDS